VRAAAQRLAAIARQSGAIVVLGGADPTGRPETYLDGKGQAAAADLVVIGEGEQTFIELLGRLSAAEWRLDADLDDLPGLALPDGHGGVRHTPECRHTADLDSIPFPARDLIDIDRYQSAWRAAHGFSSLSVIAGRGCPYGCTWCQKSVFGRTYRMRSPESVADEMAQIKERYHPDQVRVVDDVLGVDRRWLRRWHTLLAQGAVIPFEALSAWTWSTRR
jgi:anaerobic magnesium-protoporphyrin IX monomethyl ester cyclase